MKIDKAKLFKKKKSENTLKNKSIIPQNRDKNAEKLLSLIKDPEVNWTSVKIRLEKPYSKRDLFLPYILTGIIIGMFLYFYIGISLMTELNQVTYLLFLSFDICLLYKGFQVVGVRDNIFTRKGFDMKIFGTIVFPFILFLAFFIYLLHINTPFDLVSNLNYATMQNLTIILPILIFGLLIISILKKRITKIGLDIQQFIEGLNKRRYDEEYSRVKMRIKNHIFYSIFFLFVVMLFLTFLEFGLVSTLFLTILSLAVFNGLFYQYGENYINHLQKKEEKIIFKRGKKQLLFKMKKEGNEQTTKFITLKSMVFIIVVIIVIFLYFTNLFSTQDNLIKLWDIIISNNFLLSLFFVNICLFILYPVLRILFYSFIKVNKYLYDKGVKRLLYFLFFYVVFIMFIKICFFNLPMFNLEESTEWTLCILLPIFIFMGKIFLKRIIKFAV